MPRTESAMTGGGGLASRGTPAGQKVRDIFGGNSSTTVAGGGPPSSTAILFTRTSRASPPDTPRAVPPNCGAATIKPMSPPLWSPSNQPPSMLSVTRGGIVLLALVLGHTAAVATATPRPAVSLTGNIAYDDNVYGADTGPLAQLESWVATVGAHVSATPTPDLALTYSAHAARYAAARREDHVRQVFSAAWNRRFATGASRARTEFTHVSGDRDGTDYGPGHGSAFSTIIPRERREQFQNNTDVVLRHDAAPGFVRALGRLAYWDMRTASVAGANYVDRYDLQGGFDFGRVLPTARGPEMHLGYRRGYQFQDRDVDPASPRHASNHYDRFLIGYSGRLVAALNLAGQVGWSRHGFSPDPRVFAGSSRMEDLFTDLTLSWAASPTAEFQIKTSRSRTMSTTGVNTLLLTSHQLTWKQTFGARWSSVLSVRAIGADYAPAARDDLVAGFIASLSHVFDPRWSATLTLTADRGYERHPAVAGPAATQREFERNVASLSFTWKR